MDTRLPPHIESTVRSIADLQEKHDSEATLFQRVISRMKNFIGTPSFFAALTSVVALWVLINLVVASLYHTSFDGPPFILLQGVVGLAVLYMTIVIFGAQQRDDKIYSHRERMTLQLALINEQKSAKIIQLLEDLRRDTPNVRDRVDVNANAMANPVNPEVVSESLRENIARQHKVINGAPAEPVTHGSRV
jgi:uncharacterized membrane protein